MADKIREYLDAGVSLVWIVNTFFSTMTVHRSDARPQLFNSDQEISAEPFLPGFVAAVADFFEGLDGSAPGRSASGNLRDRRPADREVARAPDREPSGEARVRSRRRGCR